MRPWSLPLVLVSVCGLVVKASRVCQHGVHYYVEHARRCPSRNDSAFEELGCELFEHQTGQRLGSIRGGDQQVHYGGTEFVEFNNGLDGEKCLPYGRKERGFLEYTKPEFEVPDFCSRAMVSELTTVYSKELRPWTLSAGLRTLLSVQGPSCLVPGLLPEAWSESWVLERNERPAVCWSMVNDYRWLYCGRYRQCKCRDGDSDANCHHNAERVQCCRDQYNEFLASRSGKFTAPQIAKRAAKELIKSPTKRMASLKALARSGQAATPYRDLLIAIVRNETMDVSERSEATKALGAMGEEAGPEAAKEIMKLLRFISQRAPSDSYAMRQLVAALLQLRRWSLPYAMAILDIDTYSSEHYIFWELGRNDKAQLTSIVRQASEHLKSQDHREIINALKLLAHFGNDDAAPILPAIVTCMGMNDEAVRYNALDALNYFLKRKSTRLAAVEACAQLPPRLVESLPPIILQSLQTRLSKFVEETEEPEARTISAIAKRALKRLESVPREHVLSRRVISQHVTQSFLKRA